MTVTNAGIAVALALAVVLVMFIFPGLSPFPSTPMQQEQASVNMGQASSTATSDTTTTNTPGNTATAMPIQDNGQLQKQDLIVGTGAVLAPGDSVEIKYTGMLTSGKVFDSSDAHGGAPLPLIVAADGSLHTAEGGGLIPGWSLGVVGMKEGGKRRLIIPPALGYGTQAVGDGLIPANSTLVFDLELVSVQKGQ